MQTSGVSLEVVDTEIKATEKVIKKYRNNGCNSAVSCVGEIVRLCTLIVGFRKADPQKKEYLNMKQRTRVMKCHKKTYLQQMSFCHR